MKRHIGSLVALGLIASAGRAADTPTPGEHPAPAVTVSGPVTVTSKHLLAARQEYGRLGAQAPDVARGPRTEESRRQRNLDRQHAERRERLGRCRRIHSKLRHRQGRQARPHDRARYPAIAAFGQNADPSFLLVKTAAGSSCEASENAAQFDSSFMCAGNSAHRKPRRSWGGRSAKSLGTRWTRLKNS